MSTRMIGIAGPLEGAFFILAADQEVSIGRSATNVLVVDDDDVSDRHCIIRGEAGRFEIRDLDSGQPTFVDGIPVHDRTLYSGDQIGIGRSLFVFLKDSEAGPEPAGCDERLPLKANVGIEHSIVGESASIRKVYRFIAKVAPTDSSVLVFGESGTGKELAVRAIHQNSRRAGRPFVAINCAALAPTLLESELFGHEKGAFTGALAQKKGKLEMANGGSVFLDEIGELGMPLQSKLLRALQEREFERVGGNTTVKVDVRLLAATNRNLEEAIEAGEFRRDLYYRLNVVSMRMPALRERREDIPLLANYFIANYSAAAHRHISGLSLQARACLLNYDWPGNVRELENAIQHAVVLGSTELILPEDLPEPVLETTAAGEGGRSTYHDGVREAKKRLILNALDQASGNYTEAAKALGVHPNYLHRLVRNLHLREDIGNTGRGAAADL